MSDYAGEFSGPLAMAEEDLCRAVGETLDKHYAGHPWNVGADLQAGTIVVELAYVHPTIANATFGYRLHPATLMGAGGQKRVMQAGGELLERWGLTRGRATMDSGLAAKEHGLIADDTRDGARMAKKAIEKWG